MNSDQLMIKKLSIIIADDHPSVRYGIKSILEEEEFVEIVYEAKSGPEVISILGEKPIDVVIMDITMPGGDGLIATDTITQHYPNTKVIAISMHNEGRYVREMFDKGAKGYLLKNADREIIIDAIKEVCSGGTYISEEISNTIQLSNNSQQNDSSRKSHHPERLREIIYLMCFEMTSKEIANILCLSPRTVEQYRRHINGLIGSVSMAGVINYANEQGIRDDIILKNKFDKKLNLKKR